MSRTPRPAVRKGQKGRVGLMGPSGSGKSWTGLEVATTLAAGEPVLVFDTERGSASLYADYFTFEVIEWEPPYDPRELAAEVDRLAPSYGAILVDSSSHFWEGEGGTRDIVDAAAARARGNSFAGWKEGTPAQNDMIAALLRAPCHVIVTMRSKTEYVLEERNGKQVPRKVGMAPIQRAGIEYEFTVTADLDYEHTLLIDKTRCHPLAGRMFKVGHTIEMAEVLRDWLGSAEPMASQDQVAEIMGLFSRFREGPERKTAKDSFLDSFGVPSTLTAAVAIEAQQWLTDRLDQIATIAADSPAEAIGPKDLAILAGEVFGEKGKTLDRLRHALAYAVTQHRAHSFGDLTPEELHAVRDRLDDIAEGRLTFDFDMADNCGVSFAGGGGGFSVLWSDFEASAEDGAEAGAA